jgi:pimeloyl-ACP methyl ester carboxylesterase
VAGELDRLVPLVATQSLAALRPEWSLHVMGGVGHTPMMEDPAGFADVVFEWMDGPGAAAVRAAEHEEILRPLA